jgi:hypothetical protein
VRWDGGVPEYDAFGREIGEDPLSQLREAVNPPPPKPVPVAEPAEPERVEAAAAPPIEFVRPRRRRRRGGLAGLLVIVAIVAGVGLAANAVVEKGEDFIREIQPPDAEPPPTGLGPRSLVREANFASALTKLREADLGRPMRLRVAPDRIDATLIKDGERHEVQLNADGELREFSSTPGPGRALAYKAIDATAPERLVRQGATGKHPARSIDYVLVNAGPPVTVGAYFKRGRIVIGDRHGRPQRVI